MKRMIKNTKIFSITKKVTMKILDCLLWGKYKTLVLSTICSKYKNEEEKIFKEEGESIEILKILRLIENI